MAEGPADGPIGRAWRSVQRSASWHAPKFASRLPLIVLTLIWIGSTAASSPSTLRAMPIDEGGHFFADRAERGLVPDAPDALLTLGGTIFADLDDDGAHEPGDGETGVGAVLLRLYRDDGSTAGELDAGDTFLDEDNSIGGGAYAFDGLSDGDYLVAVAPVNFGSGGALEGQVSSSGNDPAPDPDDDQPGDDNGLAVAGFGVASRAISLSMGSEPTGDGDGDADTNLTLDFGFSCRLCLGDRVFLDLDEDGLFDVGTEPGIEAVTIRLYRDANADGQFSSGDVFVDSLESGADGQYLFCDLKPGDYLVVLDPGEHLPGGALVGLVSSPGNDPAPDPDDDVDDDDNGAAIDPGGGLVVASQAVTLTCSLEPGKLVDGDDEDGNRTVDLGLVPAEPALSLSKTVYAGHDGGASCAGGELLTDFAGSPITYCFELTNEGDTFLDAIEIEDASLGIDLADLSPVSAPSLPLAPGASASWFFETTLDDDLLNLATAQANPSDSQGLDLPGLGDPSDEDEAEVEVLEPGTPAIEIRKSADPSRVYAGQLVTYTYQVENTGQTVLADVQASDDRCSPLVYVSGDTGGDGLLGIGEVWTYRCAVPLWLDTTNTAVASGQPSDESGDPIPGLNPVEDEDQATVDVIHPDIELTKSALPTRLRPGESVTYSFFVHNPGDDPLTDLQLTDDFCSPITGPISGDSGVVGQLDPGETWLFRCTTPLNEDRLNRAEVEAEDSLGGSVEDADEVFVDVVVAGLQVEKSADATRVYSGSLVTYTYRAENTGQDPLEAVELVDDRCAPLAFDGGDTDGDGALDPGETWTYTCSQTLTEDTVNTVTGGAEDPLGNPVTADEAVESVRVIHPAIEVAKSGSPAVIEAGQAVVYQYLVTNPGDDALADVTLTDDTCGPVSGPQAGGDADADGLLDPGEVWAYACGASPAVDTTNTVVASGTDSLGGGVEDEDTAFVDVVRAEIQLVKAASASTVYPGTTVTYTLAISNPGEVALDALEVSDDACGLITGPDPSGDLDADGLLDPGEVWIYQCSAMLVEDRVNQATVTANPVDEGGEDLPALVDVVDGDTAEVDVIDPAIELVKMVDPAQVTPGNAVTWTFEVGNIGDDPLSDIELVDDGCSPLVGPDPAGDLGSDGVLDPGETWSYRCVDVVSEDRVNQAEVTGQDSLGNPVSDEDTALVDAQDVELSLVKTVEPAVVYAGQLVTYTYRATNLGSDPAAEPSVVDDRCALIVFVGGDDDADGLLDPGEEWIYRCQATASADVTNIATLEGEDLPGSPLTPDSASAELDVIAPAIAVDKSADPLVVGVDGSVTYDYRLRNPGDDPLANPSLSDDRCAPIVGPSGGDLDADGLLDPGEVWTYQCTAELAADTTNTVIASGDDSLGNPVTDEDEAFVDVVAPALSLVKTVGRGGDCPGDDMLAVTAGQVVSYCYAVTNTGDTPLSDLVVTDDVLGAICDIPGPLAPGETGQCIATAEIVADVVNTGAASGNPTDDLGQDLPGIPEPIAEDGAEVDLVAPGLVVTKTVYAGHDSGVSCPGGTLASELDGSPVTYCFALTNSGDTHLDAVTLLDADLGLSQAEMIPLPGPSLPLAPGDTLRWYLEAEIAGDLVNRVEARANPSDEQGQDLPGLVDPSDEDEAEVEALEPGTPEVVLDKEASPSLVYPGGTATYTYTVSNPGATLLSSVSVSDDRCAPVLGPDPAGDANANGLLDPGEVWTYTCSQPLSVDTTNTASVSAIPVDEAGNPIPGLPPVSGGDEETVEVIHPDIELEKEAIPDQALPGQPVRFVFVVENPGDDPLSDIELIDDACSPVLGPQAGGDADGDGLLDPGEVWVYECTTTPSADTLNRAIVRGEDRLGGTVEDEDEAFVDLIVVGLELEKSADATRVYSGSLVTYTYTLQNSGSEPANAVQVGDDRCAPVNGPDPAGDVDTDGLLDPGETWVYTCSQVLAEDTTNLATAEGEDPLGNPVTPDQATETVEVIQPAIRVQKSASPQAVLAGGSVTYQYQVDNPGDDPISDLTLVDDTCGPIAGLQAGGDADGDGLLDPGEVWLYSCSANVAVDTLNTVVVSGLDSLGGSVEDEDTAFVEIVAPSIELVKQASAPQVYAGQPVTFTIEARNTGDVSLDPVAITDDRCSPLSGPDPAGDLDADGLLDPGETWVYSCSQILDEDQLNTASATFNPVDENGVDLPGLPDVGDVDQAEVDTIDPSVQLVKTADPPSIAPGDTVDYRFELSNTGDDPLSSVFVDDPGCSPILGPDPAGDVNTNGLLDPGETWVYTCSVVRDVDVLNRAAGGGEDSLGNPVTDEGVAFVDALDIDLTLDKSVDRPIIDPGQAVTYTYLAGNIGSDPAQQVLITDDRCAPVLGPEPGGDINSNGLLDPGETWVYSCTAVLTEDTVNLATLTGEDSLGNPQEPDSDLAAVDVIRPAIQVLKTADPEVILAGGLVDYRFEVRNPGDDPLSDVSLSDDRCAPLSGPEPGGDANGNGLLDPGETWVYTCSRTVNADTLNQVTASGRDSLDRPVEDRDEAFVDVVAPALSLRKTVSTGGSCPGQDALLVIEGSVVLYCYQVTNNGDTFVSDIVVVDDVLGPICAIPGPLAPGASQTCSQTATIDAPVTNVGSVRGQPVDPTGDPLPGVPEAEGGDAAEVGLADPSVSIEKTVYAGHDAGAGCPGSELILGSFDQAVTWCFAVTNTGDTYLSNIQILDLDLGVATAQLTLGSGSLPLAPGATALWYYEGSIQQDRVNRAEVEADPSDPSGVDLPGLPLVTDEDTAAIERRLCLGDRIFYDLDDDGRFEPADGEIGLNDVLLNLYRDDGSTPGQLDAADSLLGSVLTAGGGVYEFCLLAEGDYIVQVDPSNFDPGGALPLGVSSSGPAGDPNDDEDHVDDGEPDALGGVSSRAIRLEIGSEPVSEDGNPDSNRTLDFGFIGSGSIGDTVWLDADGNGQPDPGEGIPDVLVRLQATINGQPMVYTTRTDADGNYRFDNLFGGDYRVTVVVGTLPFGLAPIYDMDGVQTPNTALVSLLSGEVILLADFGYQASLAAGSARAKLFYQPGDGEDLYVNQRGAADLPTLRLYGQTAVCDPLTPGQGNLPVTAGSNLAMDAATLLVPEDPPYSDPEGPFSPLSDQSPEADYVTWNPAWISERLGDPALMDDWACAGGLDEVSAGSNIRAGGVNASQKVWLRTWYEPTHLDKDLNADSCLTDLAGAPGGGPDGIPDAPMNPTPTSIDEWYPAILTELTYMLVENTPLPQADPAPAQLHRSAPRPTCGAPGAGTRIVFPAGTELAETLDGGPATGQGLTSLDVDFDGQNDMITVADEETLPAAIGGTVLDFDGDGTQDPLDGDRGPGAGALSCDELAVLHTDALRFGLGETVQFLDHFLRLEAVTGSGALLEIVYNGDLQTRPFNPILLGNGATALAGDIGPAQIIPPGGSNLGQVPVGPWFVHLVDSDPDSDTAIVVLGRGLGAPCASMEDGPNQANLQPGSPYFLKRFYVDGHEYNLTAIMTCETGGLQYLSLRAPLPKVPVTIEQHSVRLQAYGPQNRLVLPPPFNHEHTILEDVAQPEDFGACPILPPAGQSVDRPDILYFGGPIGPVPPVLSDADALPYTGRNPSVPVGPYTDTLASSWFYLLEDVNPGLSGQLREKYGATNTSALECPPPAGVPDAFFYNEQILSAPNHFTEFHLPQLPDPSDPGSGRVLCDADSYSVTSNLIDPNARLRRWRMPDAGVPAQVPPLPPDLIADYPGFDPDSGQYGAPRRASFEFDPDQPEKLVADEAGIRLYGGFEDCPTVDCQDAGSRPSILAGAGDVTALTDPLSGAPVEVLPYTDPFAPFNPQHPDAPRSDSLTFNPAFLSEFQHSGEDLAGLYAQIANNGQNALQKVYQRMWYQPDYISKLRFAGDCQRDIVFPALVQEYSFLPLDTTLNPLAMRPGSSRLAFPMATRAEELPQPGSSPPGSDFGYGLTTFDADFDGRAEAVDLHTEASINARLDAIWQAVRPSLPGFPPPPVPGPILDFDGDGSGDDDLDEDCIALNGNEMLVLSLSGMVLDVDAGTPSIGRDLMFLDHMVRLSNVTAGSNPRAQLEIRYTGGDISAARPQLVAGGLVSLNIGDALVADHLGGGLRRLQPGEDNLGDVDGAWFLFVEDLDPVDDLVVLTVGRALGASHSAIDDGLGGHDLVPGDPWYLKRFYVDGHEYNVVALMTRTAAGGDPLDPAECNGDLAFLTLRTPVPKGRLTGPAFNSQDSLFQQGYFLDGLPADMSVLPPFNVDHTIAVDIERIAPADFDDPDGFVQCTGPIRPAGPLVQTIRAEEIEPRRATELRETYSISGTLGTTPAWETHQAIAAAPGFTEIALPEDQTYLLTMQWRSRDMRLSFYGCTRLEAGPYDEDNPPPLSQADLQAAADCWRSGIVPADEDRPAPYVGPRLGGDYGDLPAPGDPAPPPPPPPSPPIAGADLRLEKRALTQTPVAGTQFAYLIEVFNDGPGEAGAFVVTDELPAGLSYASDTTGGACSLVASAPDHLECSFDGLTAGDSLLFAILSFVDPGVLPGTPVVNTASVELAGSSLLAILPSLPAVNVADGGRDVRSTLTSSSDHVADRPWLDGDPNPVNNVDSATVFVVAEADLGLSSLATAPDPVVAGEVFTSSFRIGNAGPSDAPAWRLRLETPAGTRYAGSRGAVCGGLPLGGQGWLTCEGAGLPLGGELVVDIALRVDPDLASGTQLRPTPRLSLVGGRDPDAGDALASGEASSIAEVDLSIARSGPTTLRPGQRFDWTYTIHNDGPSDARGLRLIETLPPALRVAGELPSGCDLSAEGIIRCDRDRLAAGASWTFRLGLVLDPLAGEADLVGARTELSSETTERVPADNVLPVVELVLIPEADRVLQLTALGKAAAGGQLDWQVQVANAGPSAAIAPRVTLSLPDGLRLVDGVGDCRAIAGSSSDVECLLDDLTAGAVATRALRTRVDADLADGIRLELRAVLDADPADPNADNDLASVSVPVERQADLVVGIEAPEGPVLAGETLRYAITVANRGPTRAEATRLSSRLPAGSQYLGDDGACSLADGKLICDPGPLDAGAPPRRIEVELATDPALRAGSVMLLRAAATTPMRERQPADNAAARALELGAAADLRLEPSAGAREAVAGEDIDLRYQLHNVGPSLAPAITWSARLRPGLQPVTLPERCILEADQLRCELGDLPPDGRIELPLRWLPDAGLEDGARIELAARIDSGAADPAPEAAGSILSIEIARRADLQLALEGPRKAEPDAALRYRLRVVNAGPSLAGAAWARIALPEGLDFERAEGGDCTVAVDVLDCELGDLAVGLETSVEIFGRSEASLADGSLLRLAAEAASSSVDPEPADDRAELQTTIRLADEADLAIGLTVDEPRPAAGSSLQLEARVDNAGPRPAPESVVDIALPPALELESVPAGCALETPAVLRCSLGEIAVGGQLRLALPLRVGPAAVEAEVLAVEASVEGSRLDPSPADDRARVELNVTRRADLALTMDFEPQGEQAVAGEMLRLDLHIDNLGPSPSLATELILDLPPGASYRSDEAGCDAADLPRLRCGLTGLEPGAFRQVEVTVDVDSNLDEGASLVVTAEHLAAEDPEPANDRASLRIEPVQRADLRLSIDADPIERLPGEPFSYTLRVENLGPSQASGLRVIDRLPEGLIPLSDDAGCQPDERGQRVCALGRLDAGASLELGMQARLAEDLRPGSLRLEAEVESRTEELRSADNRASADIAVGAQVDLGLDLWAEVDDRTGVSSPPQGAGLPVVAVAGRTLRYQLDAHNAGPADATDLRLRLQLPEGLRLLGGVDPACEAAGDRQLDCAFDRIAAGGSQSASLDVVSSPTLAEGAHIEARAELSAAEPGVEPGPIVARQETRIGTLADLGVTTRLDPVGPILPGERLELRVDLGSQGPSLARGARLRVELPAGFAPEPVPEACVLGADGVLECQVGDLMPEESQQLTLGLRADPSSAAGARPAAIEIGSETADPDSTNDRDVVELRIGAAADLQLEMEAIGTGLEPGEPPVEVALPGRVVAGLPALHRLRLRNAGPATTDAPRIRLRLPEGLRLLEAPEVCRAAALPELDCLLEALPAGADYELEIATLVDAALEPGHRLRVEARVEAGPVDAQPGNDVAAATLEVESWADLAIAAETQPSILRPGEVFSLTLGAANRGPSLAREAAVMISLPGGLRIEALPEACTSLGGAESALRCQLGDLAVGGTVQRLLYLRVDAESRGELELAAAVVARSDEPRTSDNTARAGVLVRVDAPPMEPTPTPQPGRPTPDPDPTDPTPIRPTPVEPTPGPGDRGPDPSTSIFLPLVQRANSLP